jgi:hypothetical protein
LTFDRNNVSFVNCVGKGFFYARRAKRFMVIKLKSSFGVGQFLLFAAVGLAFMHPVLGAEPSITPGSTNGALTYYTNLSRILVGFSPTQGLTTLDNALAFLGYPISGQKLETLDPAVLMAPDHLALEGGVEI